MNCKPGDMAIIVRIPHSGHAAYISAMRRALGKVVTVCSVSMVKEVPVWEIQNPIWLPKSGSSGHQCITGIEDWLLQPIRGQEKTVQMGANAGQVATAGMLGELLRDIKEHA